MLSDNGFGKLEKKLINLLRSGEPDFDAAERLIAQGADVNAVPNDSCENVLSAILHGYGARAGYNMCRIIQFFLGHGFDVNKSDGCYGAQCLYALTFSTSDRYIIEATKILLDAGAKNRTISADADSDDTPMDAIGDEGSYQDICENNHSLANIYEAVYQIYLAANEGRQYRGIDSYETAVGKRILKVLATRKGIGPVFRKVNLPTFSKENCYSETLYFVYEDGYLVTTQYADFWVDSELPDCEMADVSEHFSGIVGDRIKSFAFDTKTVVKGTHHYCQPIIAIGMDSGKKAIFSINFGDVEDRDRAAYFEIK